MTKKSMKKEVVFDNILLNLGYTIGQISSLAKISSMFDTNYHIVGSTHNISNRKTINNLEINELTLMNNKVIVGRFNPFVVGEENGLLTLEDFHEYNEDYIHDINEFRKSLNEINKFLKKSDLKLSLMFDQSSLEKSIRLFNFGANRYKKVEKILVNYMNNKNIQNILGQYINVYRPLNVVPTKETDEFKNLFANVLKRKDKVDIVPYLPKICLEFEESLRIDINIVKEYEEVINQLMTYQDEDEIKGEYYINMSFKKKSEENQKIKEKLRGLILKLKINDNENTQSNRGKKKI